MKVVMAFELQVHFKVEFIVTLLVETMLLEILGEFKELPSCRGGISELIFLESMVEFENSIG